MIIRQLFTSISLKFGVMTSPYIAHIMCVFILKRLIRPHDATLIYAAYVKNWEILTVVPFSVACILFIREAFILSPIHIQINNDQTIIEFGSRRK